MRKYVICRGPVVSAVGETRSLFQEPMVRARSLILVLQTTLRTEIRPNLISPFTPCVQLNALWPAERHPIHPDGSCNARGPKAGTRSRCPSRADPLAIFYRKLTQLMCPQSENAAPSGKPPKFHVACTLQPHRSPNPWCPDQNTPKPAPTDGPRHGPDRHASSK